MKIYHFGGYKEKNWKDKKNVTLYHISPENFSRFSPKSSFRGKYRGVYFSPSYRSLIRDWAYYVKGKKDDKHTLHQLSREISQEQDRLRIKIKNNTITEEEKLRVNELEDQLDKIRESMGKETFREQEKGYKSLYLYTVVFPPEAYREAHDIFYSVMEAEEKNNSGEINYGFWYWGEQIFIPDYLLNQIKITNVKKLDSALLSQERVQVERKPFYITPTEENERKWCMPKGKLVKQPDPSEVDDYTDYKD